MTTAMNKASIIKYFCEMNIDMLDLILDEDLTYQDVYKDQFLKKLENVFLRFKADGDTYLRSYTGKCIAAICNMGCSGYLFVGNQSNNYIAFIFEERNNCLQDIYCCISFETQEKDLVLANPHPMRFAEDEKANFKPTIEYSIQLQQCEMAYASLITGKTTCLYTEDYLAWLQQYEPLFKLVKADFRGFDYTKFDTFCSLFMHLYQAKKIIDHKEASTDAMKAYAMINLEDKDALAGWLIQYQSFFDMLSDLIYNMFTDDENQLGFIQLMQVPNVFIEAEPVKFAIQDCEIFYGHYWPVLKMYADNTFDEEDSWEQMDRETEEFINRYSLQYHYEKRKSDNLQS